MEQEQARATLIYPRLSGSAAQDAARRLSTMTVEEAGKASSLQHPEATFAPSGGTRVQEDNLRELIEGIRAIAARYGYPDHPASQRDEAFRLFDASVAPFIHATMNMSASEASSADMWAFMGCVIAPDLARWRWPGRDNVTDVEHFLGRSRGVRNVLGRLWWRAEIIGYESPDESELLRFLNEDELVGIMERPGLAGNRILAREICLAFRSAVQTEPDVSRMQLMRDLTKRVRRLLSIVSFETMSPDQVRAEIDTAVEQSILALRARGPSY